MLRCSGNLATLSWKILIENRGAMFDPIGLLDCVNRKILPAIPLHRALNSASLWWRFHCFRLATAI